MIIAGDPSAADTKALIVTAQRSFCPNLVLIIENTATALPLEEATGHKKDGRTEENKDDTPLFREVLAAYGGGYGAGEGGKSAAYVCFDNACSTPVYTPADLRGLLG